MPDAAAVAATFGANAARASRYAELLATAGIDRGLIGPREADRIWERHLFNSAALAGLVPPGASVADLGSGAGLPGIPLALARPDLSIVLLEPMARRVAFLEECVADLALANVTVVRGRAEDGIAPLVEIVVARAVAPLATLAALAFNLCRASGVLLALKGAKVGDEVADVTRGGHFEAAVHSSTDAVGAPATVAEVRRTKKQGRKSR